MELHVPPASEKTVAVVSEGPLRRTGWLPYLKWAGNPCQDSRMISAIERPKRRQSFLISDRGRRGPRPQPDMRGPGDTNFMIRAGGSAPTRRSTRALGSPCEMRRHQAVRRA